MHKVKKIVLEKYLSDCHVGENFVSLNLSQEETFLFSEGGNVEVQARILTTTGDALASDILFQL